MTSAAMTTAALRDRLRWDTERGTLHDGPRRYLAIRPDVLMGAAALLEPAARQAWFDALAGATRQHGAQSLRAYAEQVGGDEAALLQATCAAAADLGWGRWTLVHAGPVLTLVVTDSPFAAGWRAATGEIAAMPVCAPIRGMLAGLAELLLGAAASAEECGCAAQGPGDGICRFSAKAAA